MRCQICDCDDKLGPSEYLDAVSLKGGRVSEDKKTKQYLCVSCRKSISGTIREDKFLDSLRVLRDTKEEPHETDEERRVWESPNKV